MRRCRLAVKERRTALPLPAAGKGYAIRWVRCVPTISSQSRLRFVAKNQNTNPWLFLVEGKKDAKSYMDVLPTLIFDQQTAARLTHYGDYE